MFFGMIYVLRPTMLLLGANPIEPQIFYDLSVNGSLACLSAALFCLLANLSFIYSRTLLVPIGRGLFPLATPSFYKLSGVFTLVLSGLSFLIVLSIFQKFGSVQGIVYAAKIEKSLQGTFAQRQIVALAAFFAITTGMHYFYEPNRNRLNAAFYLSLGGFNLFAFSLWGSRLEAFVMISAVIIYVASGGKELTKQALSKFMIAGLGLLSLATLLYIVRLAQLSSWDVANSRDLFTTTAISLHMTRFDSLTLVHQDFSSPSTWRDGIDFYNGLIMSIPRSIWPGKPEDLLIGQWFRRVYQPSAVNGWTVGAPGEYLINFGWFGVLLGGAAWGVIMGILDAGLKFKIGQETPLGVMTGVVLALIVLPEGSPIQLLPRTILWVIPIWLTIMAARVRWR